MVLLCYTWLTAAVQVQEELDNNPDFFAEYSVSANKNTMPEAQRQSAAVA